MYPDVMLTTGDDVCYGPLAFKCNNQLFSVELQVGEYASIYVYMHVLSII